MNVKDRQDGEQLRKKALDLDSRIKGVQRKIRKASAARGKNSENSIRPLERKLNGLRIERIVLEQIIRQSREAT